jgi:hypothetical protein
MDLIPSTPPQVSYQGGMLTIVARNSTLGDILRRVQKLTGATIEVPGNANERVATQIGPGPARDVLASLLNGCAFNYVMVGSTSDPNALASVILTPKTAGGGETVAQNNSQPPPQYQMQSLVPQPGTGPGGPVVQQAANAANSDDEDADDKDDETDEDQAPQNAQNGQAAQPDANNPAAQDAGQTNGTPKSPQEILEMLRQKHPGAPVPGQPISPQNQQQPPDQEQ